jgi:hypothetical protein
MQRMPAIFCSLPCKHSLRSFIQRNRPGPRLLVIFRNKLISYGEELLAPRQTTNMEDHPLSAVRDCLFNIFAAILHIWSRDSVVGVATGYGLDEGGGRSSSPGRVTNFLHVVQTGSGVHPSSYPMDTGGSFPGGKAAGA